MKFLRECGHPSMLRRADSSSDIDDFHPDVIYGSLPVFDALRITRDRLSDPSTFAETAHDLYGAAEPKHASAAKPELGGDLIERLLAEADAAPARARVQDDLQTFIREAVRPYLVAREDPRAPGVIRQVDEAAAGVMRGIIHDHAFQSMEAIWRTVLMLVRRLETGTDLKIYLIDVTKEELSSETQAVNDLIVNRADSLAVLVGMESFGTSDIPVLSALARIARKPSRRCSLRVICRFWRPTKTGLSSAAHPKRSGSA